MTPIDLGALVVIAARVLEEDVPAVLDLLNVAAAEAALAEAALTEAPPTKTGTPEAPLAKAGTPEARATARAAALLSALVGHRPLARGNEQVAVLATVTFLAVNGWQVDLEPAGDTAAVVAGLAAGRWSAADLTTWLSPRISGSAAPQVAPEAPAHETPPHQVPAHEAPAHEPRTPSPAKEAPMHGWLPNLRRTARRKEDQMFRRFSPRAREVIISAQQEARALHHNYIGTEHVLLGLLHDREGVAGRAWPGLGISPETVREQILDIIGEGHQEPAGHIPFTPRAKRVLELAVREAAQLGHLYVGTEHILLGLVREGDGVGCHVLSRLGVTVPKVREQVLELVSQDRRKPSEIIAPPGIRDYDTRIELARQAKDAAVDAKDFDRAAAARESEKELLAERDRLIAHWSAGVDVATLGRELDWLRDEVNRLQGLLLQNGIEPGLPSQPGDQFPGDPGPAAPHPAVRLSGAGHRTRRSLCPAVRRAGSRAARAQATPVNCRARCTWDRQSPPVARWAMGTSTSMIRRPRRCRSMVMPVSAPQPGASGRAASNAARVRQRCPFSGWAGSQPVARRIPDPDSATTKPCPPARTRSLNTAMVMSARPSRTGCTSAAPYAADSARSASRKSRCRGTARSSLRSSSPTASAPVSIAAPLPRVRPCRRTIAPAFSATKPVPSPEPSSTTTSMSAPGTPAAAFTVAWMRSDSFLAGMTMATSPLGGMRRS